MTHILQGFTQKWKVNSPQKGLLGFRIKRMRLILVYRSNQVEKYESILSKPHFEHDWGPMQVHSAHEI